MAALIDAINIKRKMFFEFENTPYHCLEAEVKYSYRTRRPDAGAVESDDADVIACQYAQSKLQWNGPQVNTLKPRRHLARRTPAFSAIPRSGSGHEKTAALSLCPQAVRPRNEISSDS